MLLTDGVMGWKSSQQTRCAIMLTGHVVSIITPQALTGCQNSHYITEKGKASALRELNVARREVLHYVRVGDDVTCYYWLYITRINHL